MDKTLRNSLVSVCVAAIVFLGAAATILIQISHQLHQTPNLMLKVEATVDYIGRSAKNFDDATKTWKDASQTEADYLHNTLPALTTQIQTNLSSSNDLLRSVKTTSDTLASSVASISGDAHQTLSAANTLFGTTNQTIAGLQPAEKATIDTLFKFQTSLDLFNTTLSDPNIKATMFNVAGMTVSGNHMLFTADQVETKATHRYLFPSHNPIVRAWEFTEPILVPSAQITGALLAR